MEWLSSTDPGRPITLNIYSCVDLIQPPGTCFSISLILGPQNQRWLHPNARKMGGLCCFRQWGQILLWSVGTSEWSECLSREVREEAIEQFFKDHRHKDNRVLHNQGYFLAVPRNHFLSSLCISVLDSGILMNSYGIRGCTWQLNNILQYQFIWPIHMTYVIDVGVDSKRKVIAILDIGN